MKKLFLASFCALILTPAVSLADYESGIAAYEAENYDEAFQILKPLADNGDSEAQYQIAEMYKYGEGTAESIDEAIVWYKKSAEQLNSSALFDLGWMHKAGRLVATDLPYAYMWFSLGLPDDDGSFATLIDDLNGEMTSAQKGKAQQLIDECTQKNFKGC